MNISGLTDEDIKKNSKIVIKRSIFNVLDELFKSYVPWGILTGIRPVKIIHNLLDKGLSEDEIRQNLKTTYLIKDEKIDLALDIAKRERVFIYPIDKNKISLYVSIPFCPTRCYYCSFPANPLKQFGHLKKSYLEKLIIEIKGLAKLLEETKKRNMFVMIDIVANHTSDQHKWFKEALKGEDNPYYDYYGFGGFACFGRG